MRPINITLVSALPDHADERQLSLAHGATVRDALAAAGLDAECAVGIWGKAVPADTLLTDGDRVELYRPLIADPKLARKKRAADQGYRWQGRTRRAARQATPREP